MRKTAVAHIPLAADPTTDLSAGSTYYNTTTKRLRTYDGTSAWFEYGAGGGTPATTVQTESGLDAGQVGTSTNYAREDHRHPITNLVDLSTGQTVGGAKSFSALITANAGVTIPSGQPLTVGTKKTYSGTLALAATGNTATALGQFSSTAGSVSLRAHVHLVTGAVERTKTYEFVVDTATDTTNTYYYVLPADQSSAQATTSDAFLVCYRPSTATTTWQFWLCTSATFASTGTVTWSIESYGDSVVTYASTLSPATTAPALPFTVDATHVKYHPSNDLDTVAGQVALGTDSPTSGASLDVAPPTGHATLYLRTINAAWDSSITFRGNGGVNGDGFIGQPSIAGTYATDTSPGDLVVLAPTGRTLRLGVGGGVASTLRVNGSDAQINDNGTARSIPRGTVGSVSISTTTASITTTEVITTITGCAFTAVTGRRYRVTVNIPWNASAAGSTAEVLNFNVRDGGASNPTATSTLLSSFRPTTPGSTTVMRKTFVFYVTGLSAGTHTVGVSAVRLNGSGTYTVGNTTAGLEGQILVEDVGV